VKPENAIEVNDVTKKFKVFLDKGYTLKELTLFSKRRKYEEREVLKGISFEVKKGEAIGLIGHNGCGKSTTLKLLTKIMYPDSGTIEMKGRVSSLIELGAGFHPDMSGRQNIYTNASIFGLTRKEIDQRMDDIIAFSELEEFIDNPIRTYSSGMYMRLAFSVAINVDADILLIDEILAVGDANFQAKCFNKLREIKAEGTTIVIVSHALGQIEQICDRSIWIHDGLIRAEGKVYDVHAGYLKYMSEKLQDTLENHSSTLEEIEKEQDEKGTCDNTEIEIEQQEVMRWGAGDVQITELSFMSVDGEKKNVFITGDDVILKLNYKIKKPVKDAVIGFSFSRNDGIYCYGTNTQIDRMKNYNLIQDGEVQICLNKIGLLPGEYYLDLEIKNIQGITQDYLKRTEKIQILNSYEDVGIFRMEHEWNIIQG